MTMKMNGDLDSFSPYIPTEAKRIQNLLKGLQAFERCRRNRKIHLPKIRRTRLATKFNLQSDDLNDLCGFREINYNRFCFVVRCSWLLLLENGNNVAK